MLLIIASFYLILCGGDPDNFSIPYKCLISFFQQFSGIYSCWRMQSVMVLMFFPPDFASCFVHLPVECSGLNTSLSSIAWIYRIAGFFLFEFNNLGFSLQFLHLISNSNCWILFYMYLDAYIVPSWASIAVNLF